MENLQLITCIQCKSQYLVEPAILSRQVKCSVCGNVWSEKSKSKQPISIPTDIEEVEIDYGAISLEQNDPPTTPSSPRGAAIDRPIRPAAPVRPNPTANRLDRIEIPQQPELLQMPEIIERKPKRFLKNTLSIFLLISIIGNLTFWLCYFFYVPIAKYTELLWHKI